MESDQSLLTPRLRLVPIGPNNAEDLWLIHNDHAVVQWYDGWRPSRAEAEDRAREIAESWWLHDVHKWIAYDRVSGEVVGRGGLSRTPIDDDWGQLYAFLPHEAWVRERHASTRPFTAHAKWFEIGWALRTQYWGKGYASEIGRAGLQYAFEVLDASAVVSCTARHNERSRAVMERIGMTYVGEIRSRGVAEREETERSDAPFSVCVLIRDPQTGIRRASDIP